MSRFALVMLLVAVPAAAAQTPCGAPFQVQPTDTVPARKPAVLEPVIVTADRSPGSMFGTTVAASRIPGNLVATFPHATLADLFRLVPGIATVDFDGLGFDPQIMIRGFYGGGEAEYVVVMVDGVPRNRFESGLAVWDILPPASSIEAIEVVRGGASSLFGDAAVGGVINVITRAGRAPSPPQWEAAGGSAGSFRGESQVGTAGGASLAAGIDRTSGYRDHAERTSGRLRGVLPVYRHRALALGVEASGHWRDFQEPGPLLDSESNAPTASDPIFRFDHTSDRGAMLGLRGSAAAESGGLDGFLSTEIRDGDAIRTLALAPGFGDTRERLTTTYQGRTGVQLVRRQTPLPGNDQVLVGFEAGWGRLHSRYYQYQSGTRAGYAAASGERGDLDTRWSADRAVGALYGQYAVDFGPARLSIGARWDGLSDRFRPKREGGDLAASGTHHALSPKAGLNLGYSASGNLYVTVSRSFKAPTLDQLYDQRNIPVPFPPFQIRTSNPDLAPQHGTNLESGAYQRFDVGRVHATGSVSVYQTSMTDEVDFDLQSFRYVNIGRSRHRGLETGLQIESGPAAVFLNYALQDAVARTGDNAGNRLKAIPHHTISGGASAALPAHRLTLTGAVTHLGGMFLDDANTIRMPNWTRVDLQVAARVLGVEAFGEMRNVLGSRYHTTGYLDPGGSGATYLYPAAGRTFQLGVRSALR